MEREKIRELLGSDMAQRDPRFLDYCIERQDLLKTLVDPSERLVILNAPRGSGKSGLLLRLTRELQCDMTHVVIARSSERVDYPEGTLSINSCLNFWSTQLLGWIFSEIGTRTTVAFSDAAMNAVDYAEKKGSKQRNVISAVLGRLKFKGMPLEKIHCDPLVRHDEVVGLLGSSPSKFWLLLDEMDDNYDNSERSNNMLAGLLLAAQNLTTLIPGVCIRITIRPHVMRILECTYDKIPTLRENQLKVRWSADQLGSILAKRIEYYLQRTGDDLEELIAENTKSDPYIQSRTESLIRLYFQNFDLKFVEPEDGRDQKTWIVQTLATISMYRPRWLIEYCKECLAACSNDGPVSAAEAEVALYKFGKNRIAFLQAEHRAMYKDIEKIINQFSSNRTTSFASSAVLCEFIMKNIIDANIVPREGRQRADLALDIARFLHMVDFIQAKESTGKGTYKHHHFVDRGELLANWVDRPGMSWVIHPSYSNALDLDGNRAYRAGQDVKVAKPKFAAPAPSRSKPRQQMPRRRG